ncbi:ATP synthase subunit I [Novosphingobium sp. LASN5T]|nr:ATP synthase subunit I [Novosphingobium sp. LASN5T]
MKAVAILAYGCLGMASGAIHFLSLRKDANLLVAGGSIFAALGWRLGRLAVTIGTLVWAATQGAPALMAAAGGFLLARHLILLRLRMPS